MLFEDSTPAQAFFFALTSGDILLSATLVNELHQVLYRPKFDRYLTDAQREDFLLSLVETGELVAVIESIEVCRDPKDNMILELAVNGKADVIVTGDDDLLTLNPFRKIALLSPRQFLSKFT